MSTLLAQINYDKKEIYVIEEILGLPEKKENNTPALARKIQQKLYREKHIGGGGRDRRPCRITAFNHK